MEIGTGLIGRRFRQKRRELGITQNIAAQRVRTSQSQVSAFENGNDKALSRTKVEALAKLLGVDLEELLSRQIQDRPALKCCTNPECPGNMPFARASVIVFQPRFVKTNESHCRLCGEPLVAECANCHAAIQPGLHCGLCGAEFVEPKTDFTGESSEAWAARVRSANQAAASFPQPAVLLRSDTGGGSPD